MSGLINPWIFARTMPGNWWHGNGIAAAFQQSSRDIVRAFKEL
jgi:hypothetical protein